MCPSRITLVLFVLLCVTVVAEDQPRASKPYDVETASDIPYIEGKDDAGQRHWLDVYRPKGKENAPVIFFVHGGAWVQGDKDHLGIYWRMARSFARRGFVVVVINYRLSPEVKHPEHVRDVAAAFAWTKKNIAKHGGDPASIFLMGHSAGAHLVSLLALDGKYLEEQKLSSDDIRGVIAMSGVYEIGPQRIYRPIFGDDPKVRRDASPMSHIEAKNRLPFLVAYAETEMPRLDLQAQRFAAALEKNKHPVELLEVKDRLHATLLIMLGPDDDPTTAAILAFTKKHGKEEKTKE